MGLEKWVAENATRIAGCGDEEALFPVVWPCIAARLENDTFRKWRPSQTTEAFARGWIAGESFGDIHGRMIAAHAAIGLGRQPRKPKVEHVVEMGENALGFDGAHIVGAITELFELLSPDGEDRPVTVLQSLQKRLKYGLPSGPSILLFEAGFSDRPLALDLAEVVPGISSRGAMKRGMRRKRHEIEEILTRYPKYFSRVFDRVIGS